MSYLPPEYYFNGIIYNPQFFNYVTSGLTLAQANNLYLGRQGTPISVATNTTFTNGVGITAGGESVLGGLVTDTLTVSGNSVLTGTLNAGASTVASLTNSGNETITGTLGVSGLATLTNETVSGNITLSGTPTVNYIQFPDGTKQYTASSNTAVSGLFTGTTNSTSTGTGTVIIPNGGLGVGLNVTAGSIVVNGTSTLTGNSTVGGTLGVTGATTLSSTLNAGASTLASASVTGNETVGGTLGVTGNSTLTTASITSATAASSNTTGALIVTGGIGSNAKSYFNGIVNTNNTASSSTVTGAEVITGGIGVGGNSYYGGTLNVAGLSTMSGGITTTNETISGNLTLSGTPLTNYIQFPDSTKQYTASTYTTSGIVYQTYTLGLSSSAASLLSAGYIYYAPIFTGNTSSAVTTIRMACLPGTSVSYGGLYLGLYSSTFIADTGTVPSNSGSYQPNSRITTNNYNLNFTTITSTTPTYIQFTISTTLSANSVYYLAILLPAAPLMPVYYNNNTNISYSWLQTGQSTLPSTASGLSLTTYIPWIQIF